MSRRLPRAFGGDFGSRYHESRASEPEHWRKPQVVGVSFLGDLFCDGISDDELHDVILPMRTMHRHQFIILTKRIERVGPFLEGWGDWPSFYPNVWLGVSITNQSDADRMIPELLATPAAHYWISYEPALGPLTLKPEWLERIGQVIAGCESGPGARRTACKWLRDVETQCRAAGVPCYTKQASGEPGEPKVIRFLPLPGELAWRKER